MSFLFGREPKDQSEDDEASQESLLPHSSNIAARWSSPQRFGCWLIVSALTNGLLLVALIIVSTSACSPVQNGTVKSAPSDQDALRRVSLYSPILEGANLRLSTQQMNGNLWDGLVSPWYGGPDEPDKEHAWDEMEYIRMIPLTSAQVVKMGKDPARVAKFEDRYWGMGNDSYVGSMDLFHQVHCLNLLRKAAFADHPGNAPGHAGRRREMGKIESMHIKHCTNMLMQHLLCTGDTGMLTYKWVEENDRPFPDFSVNRKCKDWRQIAEFRDAHGVDVDMYEAYTKQSIRATKA